jgi:hypothetical protein
MSKLMFERPDAVVCQLSLPVPWLDLRVRANNSQIVVARLGLSPQPVVLNHLQLMLRQEKQGEWLR